MNNYLAFFGTGQCDPNKGMIETFALMGVIGSWFLLIFLARKLLKSSKSKLFRYGLCALIIFLGIVATLAVWFFTWIGLACARY